jgi:hypothetical protein
LWQLKENLIAMGNKKSKQHSIATCNERPNPFWWLKISVIGQEPTTELWTINKVLKEINICLTLPI